MNTNPVQSLKQREKYNSKICNQKEVRSEEKHLIKVKVKTNCVSSLGNLPILKNNKITTNNLISQRDFGLLELKRFRPITNRDKRRKILRLYPVLEKLFKCSSKNKLVEILICLSEKYKTLIRTYLKRCFILHLHLRQIKEISGLMANRQTIYDIIDTPELLKGNMSFANNLVKNFCKGIVNFVVLFYEDLKKENFLPIPDPARIPFSLEPNIPEIDSQ